MPTLSRYLPFAIVRTVHVEEDSDASSQHRSISMYIGITNSRGRLLQFIVYLKDRKRRCNNT